jgi:conjugative transfer signal peptidase TraF
MIGRASVFLLMVVAIMALAVPALSPVRPVVVWNATASAPLGLYRVTAANDPQPGALVLARTPAAFVALLAERGYLPLGVPLLKRVAAVAGSIVCRHSTTVVVDGVAVAEALPADGQGRMLPAWCGCYQLGPGEAFLLVPEVSASLDGRYFGVVETGVIIGRAVPLWTW